MLPTRSLALFLVVASATRVPAQTDYYNTEHHRPLSVEDATPLERHSIEPQLVPVAIERRDDGSYIWSLTPSIGLGDDNMGGTATGFGSALPAPTVPLGATHAEAMGRRHPPANPQPHDE